MSPVAIGLCLVAAMEAGTLGGLYFYHQADACNSRYHLDEATVLVFLSGFCFDAVMVAGLAAFWLALRNRSRWQSVKVLLIVAGSFILLVAFLMPSILLGMKDDPFGFAHIALFVCILLAATGAIMVTVAVVLALMGDGRHRKGQPD